MQFAALERVLPFDLVEDIRMRVLVAEEQPVAAASTTVDTFLHEAAERCDAGAGAHHDDVARPILRQAEALAALDEYRQLVAFGSAREEVRRRTPARVPLDLVLALRHGERRLVTD